MNFNHLSIHDRKTPPMGTPVTRLETDAELRDRLRYVAGDGERLKHRVETAKGEDLDWLASMFKLQRRRVS